jgi:tetratricopeptide (TPR) repeat protein
MGLGAIVAVLAPSALGLSLAHHSLVNKDIWLHDRAGQDILAGEGIPHTNTYSFTAPGHIWVDHEWLFQITIAGWGGGDSPATKANRWNVLRLGLVGLLLVYLFLGDATWRRLIKPFRDPDPVVWLAGPAIFTLALLWPRMILRPELFSYLGFVLAVRWIESWLNVQPNIQPNIQSDNQIETGKTGSVPDPAGQRPWWLALMPWHGVGRTVWLTVIWAQFHGFYVLVSLVWLLAGVLALGQSRVRSGGNARGFRTPGKALLFGLGMALITFCAGVLTPNGVSGLLYPLRALGQLGPGNVDLRTVIAEMAPLLATKEALDTTLAVFRLSLIWGVIWLVLSAGRISLLRVVIWALATGAVLYSQRNLGFYALAFYLIHSGYQSERLWLWSRIRWGKMPRLRSAPWAAATAVMPWLGLIVVFTLGAIWFNSLRDNTFYLAEGVGRRFGSGLTPAQYPFTTVTALKQMQAGQTWRIANNVDCAAVLVNQRVESVYIDGRTEAYPPDLWLEYHQLKQGGDSSLQILRQRRADAVLVAHRSRASHRLLNTLLTDGTWRPAAADEAGILFLPGPPAEPGADPAQDAFWRDVVARFQATLPPLPEGVPAAETCQDVAAADRCQTLAELLQLARQENPMEVLYRQGLRYCPHHPILNHNYGNVLLNRREFQKALGHYRRALTVNSQLVKTRINLGICLFQLGDISGAERAFAKATRLDETQAEAWVNLAEMRRRRGNRAGALEAYERALSLLPRDAVLRNRVNAYRAGSP